MAYFLTGEKAVVTTVADLSNFILIYFPSGRTYMKEMVKNMMNRRRQEEHKDETLFLDSILDCDLMNEEEVTAEAHLLSVFEDFLPKWLFSPQNPKSKAIVPKTTLRECNKLLSALYCRRMQQTPGGPVQSSDDLFCCSCHLFAFSSLSLIQRGCMVTDDLIFNI